MKIRINPLFAPVLTSKCRYFHLWGGRSRGASHFATDYFLMRNTAPDYFRGGFLRSTFGEVKASLWRAYKDRVTKAIEDGELNYQDFRFNETELSTLYIPTGNSIISKGFKKTNLNQAANLKSLEGLTHLIIEEAEDAPEEDFMKLDDSLRTVQGNIQIFCLFNPPGKNHWLIRKYYNLYEADARDIRGNKIEGWYNATPKAIPELLSIHSTWRDNSRNVNETTKNNYRAYGDPDNPLYNPDYYCRNVLGLVSEGQKGRIFTKCKPITVADYNSLPYTPFYGLDFGFNDPVALVECKYHNGRLYCKQLVYKSGLHNDQLSIQMGINKVGDKNVYADSAEPKSISTLRKMGYSIYAALKGADSIAHGIRELKNVEIYITENSTDFWHEVEEYHWALDADKNPTDAPEDSDNHLWDATRYAYTMHVIRGNNSGYISR